MKTFILFSVIIFGGIVYTCAQQPASQPTPQSTVNPAEEANRRLRQQQELDRRFEALRSGGEINRNTGLQRTITLNNIGNIYRKPSKEESKLLAPGEEDLKKYASFLRQSNTGLIKLIADRGCAEHTNVVNVSEECLKYSMPGAGASFSFRTANYSIRRLSDLTYTDNSFQALGILTHAILVNIGDLPLEQVSLQAKGLKFLTDFQTVTDFDKAREVDRRIFEGIETDDYFYSRSAKTIENATYILRSIAYRGSYYRAFQGVVYDELDFDERKDVIIAFRVIRLDADSATILWKELSSQKSPIIKRQNQKLEENKFVAKDKIDEN